MRQAKWPIIGVTVYLFIYAVAVQIIKLPGISFLLFLFGNFLLIWMVYVVLKYGKAPQKKFDEGYWYSDKDKLSHSEED